MRRMVKMILAAALLAMALVSCDISKTDLVRIAIGADSGLGSRALSVVEPTPHIIFQYKATALWSHLGVAVGETDGWKAFSDDYSDESVDPEGVTDTAVTFQQGYWNIDVRAVEAIYDGSQWVEKRDMGGNEILVYSADDKSLYINTRTTDDDLNFRLIYAGASDQDGSLSVRFKAIAKDSLGASARVTLLDGAAFSDATTSKSTTGILDANGLFYVFESSPWPIEMGEYQARVDYLDSTSTVIGSQTVAFDVVPLKNTQIGSDEMSMDILDINAFEEEDPSIRIGTLTSVELSMAATSTPGTYRATATNLVSYVPAGYTVSYEFAVNGNVVQAESASTTYDFVAGTSGLDKGGRYTVQVVVILREDVTDTIVASIKDEYILKLFKLSYDLEEGTELVPGLFDDAYLSNLDTIQKFTLASCDGSSISKAGYECIGWGLTVTSNYPYVAGAMLSADRTYVMHALWRTI